MARQAFPLTIPARANAAANLSSVDTLGRQIVSILAASDLIDSVASYSIVFCGAGHDPWIIY